MEKDNKTTVITMILVLVCLGILGYMVYFKTTRKIEKNDEHIEEIPEEIEEEKQDESTINEELIESLYSIIDANPEFRYGELINYENLSETIRDNIIINRLTTACEEEMAFEKETFLNMYRETFNHEKESEDGFCKLNEDNYECTRYCNQDFNKIVTKYEKYEQENENIIIYEEVGYLDYHDNGQIYLTKNLYDEVFIAIFDSIDELTDDIVDDYELSTYKHTFTKNGDNYYWLSSELVKQ